MKRILIAVGILAIVLSFAPEAQATPGLLSRLLGRQRQSQSQQRAAFNAGRRQGQRDALRLQQQQNYHSGRGRLRLGPHHN